MAEAYYEPTPATDGATMNPVPGAVFEVFEIADQGTWANPLSLRVGSGNPTTTVAASDTLATLPGVYVTSPNYEHIWKSGTFEWRRDSIDGAKKAIEDAKLAASNSASDAALSKQAAEDAASLVDAPADTIMRDVAANPASQFATQLSATIAEEVPTSRNRDTLAATDAYKLLPWYAALAHRDTAPASMLCLGDSWTEAYGAPNFDALYASRIRKALRATLGVTGGRGYIQGDYEINEWADPWTYTGSVGNGTSFGLARRNKTLANGATATITLKGTSVDIVYCKGGSAQPFTYKVNAGAAVTVDTQPGTTFVAGNTVRVTLGASGTHTLVITGASAAGSAFIEGVIEYDGDETKGVRVHNAGHYGYMASNYVDGNVPNWRTSLASLNPDLVTIMLGTNEYNSGIASATYKTNMQSLITNIGTALGADTPVVLIATSRVKDAATLTPVEPWANYVGKLYELAVENANVVVWNAELRLPAYETGPSTLWRDPMHPNAQGLALMGDFLARKLLPA